MAQNNTSGREPISYIKLNQKRCSRSWGDGVCTAGLTNLIPDTNPANWNDVTGLTVVGSIADPDGGTGAYEVTATNSSSYIADVTDLPIDDSQSLVISVALKFVNVFGSVTKDIHRIRLTAGTPVHFANINFVTGQVTGLATTEDFQDITVTDLGSGWSLFELTIGPESYDGSLKIDFRDQTGSTPENGAKAQVYYTQVANAVGQPYLPTSGTSTIATETRPCFNTRYTCQDPANYSEEIVPIKFIGNRSPLPRDDYYIPCLKSASVSAGELNPGGSNRSKSALGTRSTLKATFQDMPHNDKVLDPYVAQRGYDPLERGTLWSKWRARNPYYLNLFIDYVSGYLVDGAIVETTTRKYVTTGFSGPDQNGAVTISAKDILTLAEDTKAQAPRATSGKLSAAIDTSLTAFTLTGAGVGDIEYPASGKLRIDKEIMSFTRSGDTITPTARGIEGTEAASHDADAAVQLCLEYSAQNYSDILYDLLLNYASIPAANLNKTAWDTEQAAHLPFTYSAVISEPTSVSKLVSEMCEQMLFSIWWDERTGLVETRAVRQAEGEEITSLDDNKHFLAGSTAWTDKPDELMTQVWVYYGQIDKTEKLDQESNFSTVEVFIDSDGETLYDTQKIKKIYSRWINNSTVANSLANALQSNGSMIPRDFSFSLDAKDSALWIGDYIQGTNRLNVDQFGQSQPVNMQVIKSSEALAGTRFDYVAKQSLTVAPFDPNTNAVYISIDTLNLNLKSYYETNFGTAPTTGTVTFVIRSGVVIGGDSANYSTANINADSRSTTNDTYAAGTGQSGIDVGTIQILQRTGIATPQTYAKGAAYGGSNAAWIIKEYPLTSALTTGTWAAGVTLRLIVEAGAYIVGEGGNGSTHGLTSFVISGEQARDSATGGDGGHALKIEKAIEIENYGTIAGGGGGGSAIVMLDDLVSGASLAIGSGGSGAGYAPSKTSTNKIVNRPVLGTNTSASAGALELGGSGAVITNISDGSQPAFRLDGVAGGGGNLAVTGGGSTINSTSAGAGGAAGAAVISGGNDITWTVYGDVRGAING